MEDWQKKASNINFIILIIAVASILIYHSLKQ